MGKNGYVYIVSNTHRTMFYIGVTSDLESRAYQHENGLMKGFSKKYNCVDLIYYEVFNHIEPAIAREKVLKKWKREWKERIILEMNPEMRRLNDEVFRFN
ncbi:GIY-YIG nuclease family protein [Roseivirga spongicola]|uniref:Endonuclease n=1 Tax=Roseivirga spongicola TaxID=333140 RepID=A0A150XAR1_9BACT|nr:GIY-YIG nuclease family protein [Roseivirga spongicola]KYG75803.1 endonuclease [Roseivirga spongicola]WPZ10631.1 GIY-YIG nuclease family protein [Roseivirga spongicola]